MYLLTQVIMQVSVWQEMTLIIHYAVMFPLQTVPLLDLMILLHILQLFSFLIWVFVHARRLTADLPWFCLDMFREPCLSSFSYAVPHSLKNETDYNAIEMPGTLTSKVPNYASIRCDYYIYYTLNSLSLFWLAESVLLIFEIRACNVITADYSIIMSRSQVIMSRSRVITSCMTAVHDFSG